MIINTENILFYKLFYICNQNSYEIQNKNEDSRSYYLRDCVCNLYRHSHSSRMVTWGGLLFIAILVSIMRTYGKQQEMGDEEYILRHKEKNNKKITQAGGVGNQHLPLVLSVFS